MADEIKKIATARAKAIVQILRETKNPDPVVEMMSLIGAAGVIFGEALRQRSRDYTPTVANAMGDSLKFIFDDAVNMTVKGEFFDDDDTQGEDYPH